MVDFFNRKIGFLGCGNMGGAIVESAISQKFINSDNIFVFDKNSAVSDSLRMRFGVNVLDSFEALLDKVDFVVLAVKPQNVEALANSVSSDLFRGKTFLSILAGTKIDKLHLLFGDSCSIIRTMPNLGIMANSGVTAICCDSSVSLPDFEFAENLFSCCGTIVKVTEDKFDVATAISGSGPAYFFYFTERLIAEGVANGLSLDIASVLAIKTVLASANLMNGSEFHPDVLRKKVTSPGGTTEAALAKFIADDFNSIFKEAISSAVSKSIELSK